MLPYLAHTSILLAGTFALYWLLLKNETFFRLNRWILLGSVILSLTLPMISVPAKWSIRNIDTITSPEFSANDGLIADFQTPELGHKADHSSHSTVTEVNTESATQSVPTTEVDNNLTSAGFLNAVKWNSQWLWYLYFIGVAIFTLTFLVQLGILVYRIVSYPAIKDGAYRIVELDDDQAPYSFLNCIFINPAQYDWDTYTQIVAHEKIHIEQVHFFDKFIAEALIIVFWFNPFVWLFRKAITNNLEFLTDESMLDSGMEKESYQMSLLKVSVPHRPLNLTTNYNQSFLKNRIAMMNSKKSSAASSWKYLMLIPAIALSLVTLNAVTIENIPVQNNSEINDQPADSSQPTNNSNAADLEDPKPNVLANGASAQMHKSDPDPQNNLAMATGKTYSGKVNFNNFEGADRLKPGEWSGIIEGNEYCLSFNYSLEDHSWMTYHSDCFPRNAFKQEQTSDGQSFESMTREAGKLELNGEWVNNRCEKGEFNFIANPSFLSFLDDEGIRLKRESMAFSLFMADINKSYIAFLKNSDFDVDSEGVMALAVHDIDINELKELMQMFSDLNNKDYNLEDLVQFKIHDVTPKYVNELRALGLDLNTKNVVSAAIHDVEPEYIKAMLDYGLKEVDMKDMIQFAIHDVEIDYLKEMKALGFDDLDVQEIVQLNIHDVEPSYVDNFKAMGYDDMDVKDIVQFAIHDIDPSYVRSFKEAGITNLSKQDIVQAGIHDVDVKYVKAMQDAGFKEVDMQDMVQFAIHDVDVDYISGLKAAGLSDLSKKEIVQAKIHDVSPSYIKEFKTLGMQTLDMKDMVQFAIHDISPRFVKGFQAEGFEDLSKSDIVQAGIHDADADYVKSIRSLGIKIDDFRDIIQAKIHGVSPSFIKRAKEKGYNPSTLKEFTRLKISGI